MKFISLNDATNLISSTGSDVTYALLGEPGIGKTAMLGQLSEALNMRAVYVDVPSTDIADIGVPMPDHETKTTRLYPNEHWGFHLYEPLLVCLDEFSKGNKVLQTTLHPLLNKVGGHRRIGAIKLHPDSVVFITGNLTSDLVNDNLASHTINRLALLYIRKSNNDEWFEWAVDRGLEPMLTSWTKVNPRLFASYTDGQLEDNDYVYNPTNAAQRGKPYVSPRSLAVSAARDLMAHIDLGQQIPSPHDIRTNAAYATVPQSAAAQIMCVLNALKWVAGDADKIVADVRADLDAWFTYFTRMPKEAQAMFIEAVVTAGKRATSSRSLALKLMKVMVTHDSYKKWATDNHYMF